MAKNQLVPTLGLLGAETRMPLTPYVFDATPENFDALILGNSMRGLVLAHFWSPKAGPCMVLMPRLVKLAAEYGGRFLLVMVNTEELGQRARSLGVTSVPTVKFFLRGEAVHTIHGAEGDASFHAALGQFLANDEDRLRMTALRMHQDGDSEGAIELLARMAVENPADLAVAADLAKLLTLSGRPEEALALLAVLPAPARAQASIAPLLAHLELIEAANQEAEDGTPQAQLTAAAQALFEDRPEQALTGLLELARAEPTFRDDIGRRAMLALFGMLGSEHELTRHFRARLAELAV
jgi:putative thioredoxin